MKNKKKFNTKAIHVGQKPEAPYGAVSLPIYQTSTFKQSEFGKYIYDYSRADNPTRSNLEKNISSLENGIGAIAFSSGMAAISSICQLFKPGDELLFTKNVYGGTYRLMEKVMKNFSLNARWIDTSSLIEVERNISDKTKLIFVETPTNPMMTMTNISEISKIVKQKNILLTVDNTFMSPYYQRPLDLGADMVIHSSTKYIGGHSDIIGGFVVVKENEDIFKKLKFLQMSVGAVPGPFDCWLTQRSLKTLPVRMERHNENAMKISNILNDSESILKVFYPGLKNHPQHDLAKIQHLSPNGEIGFGGMISFELESYEQAKIFVKNLEIFTLAESLGGVESLVCHPATMTHASVPLEIRNKIGITPGLVRFSVGIEDYEDLKEDVINGISSISS